MLLLLVLALFGVVGNGLSLASIGLRCPEWRQNQGLMIIFSLAVNDFIYCLQRSFTELAVLVPRHLLASLHPAVAYTVAAMTLGGDVVANWHLMVLAANRFTAIVLPLRYPADFTPARTRNLCAFGWLCGIAYCAAFWPLCWPAHYSLQDGSMVWHTPPLGADNVGFVFSLLFVAFFSVCFLVLVGVYVPVTIKIYRVQHNSASQVEVDVKLCIQFLLVVGIWFMAYACFIISYVMWGFVHVAAELLVLLIYASNPVVYWFFNKTVRNGFKALWNNQPAITGNLPFAAPPAVAHDIAEEPKHKTITLHS